MSKSEEIIYLNYAATSFPKNPEVVRAYNKALETIPGGNRQGIGRKGLVGEARDILADNLNVDESSIYFSSGSTQALNEIIFGVTKPGDHCLYDNRSHNSIVRPMAALPASIKAEMCPLYRADDTLDLAALLNAVRPNTRLVSLAHASNVTGTVYDIKATISVLRDKAPNALILVDAAQSAGAVDIKDALLADFAVFQGHKHLHAPQGAAVVVAKKHVSPIIFGGGQALSGEEDDPYMAEVGTQNQAAIYATAIAFELAAKDLTRHQEHEKVLYERLKKSLNGVYGLEPLPTNAALDHVSILSYKTTVGTPNRDWVPFLQSKNIIVRGGLHCSPCIHEQLGLSNVGTLRFSLGWYSSQNDVDTTAKEIIEFSQMLKKNSQKQRKPACDLSHPCFG